LVISLSSFLAKNKEITGDMLNKAHPTPMGRVLNTTCCRNIPIFVPRSIEIKNISKFNINKNYIIFSGIGNPDSFKKILLKNKFKIIIKLKKIINFIQSPWFIILYKKYINPLKDVKQEKKPLTKIFLIEWLNLLLRKKPTKNDPIIEIKKLLFIASLKKVAK